jgi:hypothetical protein
MQTSNYGTPLPGIAHAFPFTVHPPARLPAQNINIPPSPYEEAGQFASNMTLQSANYNEPEAHYFVSISILITRPSTIALNHTFSSSATFILVSSSALDQSCSSSASASLGHQPYLLLLYCLHIGVLFSTQSSLFLVVPQPRVLFHTQTATFILASSSALNQACSFLVLNRASSSIIRGAMSNQLGMSKKQKPFSCQQKLNGPIKPKEILILCGEMDMILTLYTAKTRTTM